MEITGIVTLCIYILIVIFSVGSRLIVFESKHRQKYNPGRKFLEIHRNNKIYNRFVLHLTLRRLMLYIYIYIYIWSTHS